MDREFGYKAEKSTDTIPNISSGSLKDKSFVGPFNELSTPVRNLENTSETNGTYRSRSNNGYDNTDNSVVNQAIVEVTTSFSPLDRPVPNRPRVDHDEYWRTNI
jgi:hypothetical protein